MITDGEKWYHLAAKSLIRTQVTITALVTYTHFAPQVNLNHMKTFVRNIITDK